MGLRMVLLMVIVTMVNHEIITHFQEVNQLNRFGCCNQVTGEGNPVKIVVVSF